MNTSNRCLALVFLSIALVSCSTPDTQTQESDTSFVPAIETGTISATGNHAIVESPDNFPLSWDVASGCEFVYKKSIHAWRGGEEDQTEKIQKLDGKIRRFSLRLPETCEERRILEGEESFSLKKTTFFLPSGPKVTVRDLLDAPVMGSGRGTVASEGWLIASPDAPIFSQRRETENVIPPEIARNPNGLNTMLYVFIGWPTGVKKGDGDWASYEARNPKHNPDSIFQEWTWYEIIGYADSLQFSVQDGLTKQNVVQAANELRTILATVEELPPETPVSNIQAGYEANSR